MKCVECSRFSMIEAADMAKHGYGICKLKKPWQYFAAKREHECGIFSKADESDIIKRIEWIDKRSEIWREEIINACRKH